LVETVGHLDTLTYWVKHLIGYSFVISVNSDRDRTQKVWAGTVKCLGKYFWITKMYWVNCDKNEKTNHTKHPHISSNKTKYSGDVTCSENATVSYSSLELYEKYISSN
jgi:hypothetical protein